MHPTLKSLKITKLFGYKNIELNFNPVTVIVGKNGLGKTTILKILNALLKQEYCEDLDLCSSAELTFSNNEKIEYHPSLYDSIMNNLSASSIFYATMEDYKHIKAFGSKIDKKSSALAYLSHFLNTEEIDKIRKIISEPKGNILAMSNYLDLVKKRELFKCSVEIADFLKKKAKLSYISTINMNANSQHSIIGSDGETRNFLDFEIENETQKIELTPSGKYTLKFIKEINKLYMDSYKKMKIDSRIYIHEIKGLKRKLMLKHLSSGERQLMYIMAKVANTKNDPAFLLMDEPEISLHLNWQEKILDSIKSINSHCQIVVVTHSPAIIMNGYMDSYVEMKDITTDVEIS